MSPVRRPSSSIRAQLITAATASAQRIQDFEREVGRPAGIQLLLAGTGDATTDETVTSWPGSDGPPRQQSMLEPNGAGIRYPVAAPGRGTVIDVAVATVPRSHRYLATRNQAAPGP